MAAIARKGFSQVHFVCQLGPLLAEETLVKVAHAAVNSHFDYCNVFHMGLSWTTTRKPKQFQNIRVTVVIVWFHLSVPYNTTTSCGAPVARC